VKIVVKEVKENEDGSADAVVHFDNEGLKYLIQYAVIDILTKYVAAHPIEQPDIDTKVKLPNAISKRKASTKKTIHRGA
jgi:hypothetical protein